MLHTDDRWYLVGPCRDREAVRTFRLDRIEKLEVQTTTFERPETFDARTYMDQSLPFLQSAYEIDLWVDVPVAEAKRSFALWRVSLSEQDGGTRVKHSRGHEQTVLEFSGKQAPEKWIPLLTSLKTLAKRNLCHEQAVFQRARTGSVSTLSPNGP